MNFPDSMRCVQLEVDERISGMVGYLFKGQNGSQIVFWECHSEAKVKPHSHEYDEYCIVLEGKCTEFIDGQKRLLKKGDEILIPAGVTHWALISPPYRSIDYFGGNRFQYKPRA